MDLHFDFKMATKDGEEFILKDVLIPHILAAIATNDYLVDKIQSDYYQKKNIYSSIEGKLTYPFNKYFELFPSVERLLMKRTLQMYLYAESRQQGEDFLSVYINEGFKRIVDYSKRTKSFSLTHFTLFLNQRDNGDFLRYKKLHFTAIYMYLCCLQRKPVDLVESPLQGIMNNLTLPLRYTEDYFKKGLSLTTAEQHKAFSKYQELLGTKVPRDQTLNSLFYQLETKVMRELLPQVKKTMKDNLQFLYKQNLYRTYKTLTDFMRIYYFEDSYYIQDISISREEYLQIYAVFRRGIELERMKEEEFDLFFSASLLLMVMCKQYHRLSDAYLKHNQEVESSEKNREETDYQLQTERVKLQQEKMAFKSEKKNLLSQIERLQQQLMDTERALKNAVVENKTSEEEKEELRILREFIFNLNQNANENTEIGASITNAIQEVQQKELKIAVFGGHPRLHQRMKETFRFVRTIEPEELGIDLSFVTQMDVILFVATYNNHSQYHRFRPLWDKNRTKLIFLNNQSSIEIIASKILEEFQS